MNANQIAELLRKYAASTQSQGMAAFLASGAYSALSPSDQQFLMRALRGSPWDNQPGAFFLALRQQGQQAGNPQTNMQQDQRTPATGGPADMPNAGEPNTALPVGLGTGLNTGASAMAGARGPLALPPAGTTPGVQPSGVLPPPAASGAPAGGGPGQNGQGMGAQPNPLVLNSGSPTSGGAPPSTGGGATPGSGGNGGFSADFATSVGGDDNLLTQLAFKAAGFDPSVITPATKIAMQQLQALVKSRRAAYGALNTDQGVGGLPQDIVDFAKEYTAPGGASNFYGNARGYAQQVLAGLGGSALGGVSDQTDQFNMYQAMVPLLLGGANPMIQQSANDQLGNIYNKWDLDSAQDPSKRNILQYIQSQPNLSPLLRSIFGGK